MVVVMVAQTLQEVLGSKIDTLAEAIVALAEVNSGSYNPAGVDECGERLAQQIEPLEPDEIEAVEVGPSPSVDPRGRRVDHAVGKALRSRKRPDAPFPDMHVRASRHRVRDRSPVPGGEA